MNSSTKILSALLAVSLFASRSDACGPDFAFSTFFSKSTLPPPALRLDVEVTEAVERAKAKALFLAHPETVRQDVDREEIAGSMKAKGSQPAEIEKATERYASYRAALVSSEAAPSLWTRVKSLFSGSASLPNEIPEEFRLYIAGVKELDHNPEESEKIWTKLLELPQDQRHYRSTWALYMRASVRASRDDNAGALQDYSSLRELASQGFKDGLGLAASSYRREHDLSKDNPTQAFVALSRASISGYPVKFSDLKKSFSAMIASDQNPFNESLIAPDIASVVNAFIAGGSDSYSAIFNEKLSQVWYAKIKESPETSNIAGADALAWGAYQSGNFADAQLWLDRAPPASAKSLWVASRLEARSGHKDKSLSLGKQAIQQLESDSHYVPLVSEPSELLQLWSNQVAQELAGQGDALTAMDLFFRFGNWVDAAFLADRTLSLDTLKSYTLTVVNDTNRKTKLATSLRILLARRLLREGHFDEAAPFFAGEKMVSESFLDEKKEEIDLDQISKKYISLVQDSKIARGPQKAEALFEVAKFERQYGMELLGTETCPDWAVYNGQYSLPVDPETQNFVKVSLPFESRFHYRYLAAKHAVEAANLTSSPDKKCAMLGTAARWMKYLDNDSSQKIYLKASATCFKVGKAETQFNAAWKATH